MITTLLLIVFYFLTPILLIYFSRVSKIIKKIGAVVLAYAIGLFIGNIGLFPEKSETYKNLLAGKAALSPDQLLSHFEAGDITSSDVMANQISSVQDLIMTIVILLAIPLLLFSLDIKRWLKLAKGALFSLVLATVSLVIVIFTGYFLFRNSIPDAWQISGMLVGIYSGGTPNLAAISTALNVSPNTFILTHTYDMVIGAVALIFLLTGAQRLFNLFLPKFSEKHSLAKSENNYNEEDNIEDYSGMLAQKGYKELLKAFGISLLIVAISGGISLIVPENAQMVTIILSITTLGLFASTIKYVNRIGKSFQLGMYLIIVFSLAVSSMGDLSAMFQIDFLHLFLFVALVVFGSIIIHVFLSYIFKVDTDSTIITIAALTYSPPFVPVIASALKNKDLIISGLTVGILGYAFGNYLGVFIAYFLKGL